MWAALIQLVLGLLGLGTKKDPSGVALADSNARAQERLGQAEKANEVLVQASDARAAADARIVRERNAGGGKGNLDADPDGHWRD
jgi:hypothetical protein